MNKCFITKLPSSVDNDNLPVLGQLRINWLKQDNLTNNDARAIGLATNDSIVVKVSGAHFTDNTLTSNLGNTKTITAADDSVWLYVSNDADAILTIDNKYALTKISVVIGDRDSENSLARSIYFDIEDIKYCTNLTYVDLPTTQVSGDISAVSELTNLTNIILNNTQVSGDISAVSELTNLTNIILDNTQVSGDISAVSKLVKLYNLNLSNTQISGDISAVSKLVNLANIRLASTKISGMVDNLAGLTKISYLDKLSGTSLTGDMSKIPAKVGAISQAGRMINTNFTWTANGRQNATLLAMIGNIPFDTTSMDNMLIDQATCTFKPIDSIPWTKIISVSGTRTSASDAAVAAIQNMGVTITGVTKA